MNEGASAMTTEAKVQRYEPCPFCGGIVVVGPGGRGHRQAVCVTCGAEGPDGRGPDPLRFFWNNRPIESALSAHLSALEDCEKEMREALEAIRNALRDNEDFVKVQANFIGSIIFGSAVEKVDATLSRARVGELPEPAGQQRKEGG